MFLKRFISKIRRKLISYCYRKRLGFMGRNVVLGSHNRITSLKNLYMEDDTNLSGYSIIMNPNAKVIFKKKSGAAVGLTIITGNHAIPIGIWRKDINEIKKKELDPEGLLDADVVISEDVWIGANVTILAGLTIGRGAVIGAGSVVRSSIPPYAITIGNPAKIIGFCFTPEEILEHESLLYPEKERIPLEQIKHNYSKYFTKRTQTIKQFLKI